MATVAARFPLSATRRLLLGLGRRWWGSADAATAACSPCEAAQPSRAAPRTANTFDAVGAAAPTASASFFLPSVPHELWVLAVHVTHNPALDRRRDVLHMNKLAISSSRAKRFMECAAPGFPKITDDCQLRQYEVPLVVTASKPVQSPFRITFRVILHIDVADHVVRDVVHHDHVFDLAIVCQLHKDLLVEFLDVHLSPIVHSIVPSLVGRDGQTLDGTLVHVRKEQRLAARRSVVPLAAMVPFAACSDLEEESTVQRVFFGTIDASKVFSQLSRWRDVALSWRHAACRNAAVA
mmetsp:Transcript_59491/g.166144  ORF Transcript_59491/g.166144 Transcript_59491/m.166144 type:complete len:294 (+) Transcript_59491:772-1653(+)